MRIRQLKFYMQFGYYFKCGDLLYCLKFYLSKKVENAFNKVSLVYFHFYEMLQNIFLCVLYLYIQEGPVFSTSLVPDFLKSFFGSKYLVPTAAKTKKGI